VDSENSKIEAIVNDIISKPENFMFFLGAGFSNEIGLPTASDLGKILEGKFKERGIITEELQENEKKDLDKLIGLLLNKGVGREEICEVIKKELVIKKDILKVRSEKNFLGLFYRIINEGIFRKSREPIQINIVTTNWDEALSKVFGEGALSIFSGNEVRGRLNIPGRKIVIYHLYGSIMDYNSMVLTKEEKSKIEERDTVLWNSFKAEVDKHRILFIGYGSVDEDILNIYIKSRKNVGELKDYIIVNDEESKKKIESKLKENNLKNIATVIIINSLKFLEELARSMGLSLVTEKVELETEKRINETLELKKRVIVTSYPASGLTTLYLIHLDKLPAKKLHLDEYKYKEEEKRSFDELMDCLIKNEKAAIFAPEYLYEVYLDSYLKSRNYSKDVIDKLHDEIRVKHYVSRDSAIDFLKKLVNDSKYKDKYDKVLENMILNLVKQEVKEGFVSRRRENYPLKLLKDVFQDVNMKIANMVNIAKMQEKVLIENIKKTIKEKIDFKDEFEKIVDTAVVCSIISTGLHTVYSFDSTPKDFQDFINKLIQIQDPIKSIFFDVVKATIPFAFIGILIYEIYEFVSNLRKGGRSQVEAFVRLKTYWDSLTDSERRVLCYKLDMKNHLLPGKSEEFLNNMFTDKNWSNLKNEIDNIKDYVKRNFEEFRKKLDNFEKEYGTIMDEISKINEDIGFINDKIKSILEELQELKKRVEVLEEQQYSRGAEKIKDIRRLNEILSIEEKEENLIGLGNSESDRIVKEKINEIISNSKDHVCIIEGEAGSGKTTLLYMIGKSLLDKGSKLYYIVEPSNFSFQDFRNLDAYALYDIRDPEIANEILRKKLREDIVSNVPLAKVIISVRTSYLKDSKFDELKSYEGFNRVHEVYTKYDESVLQEMAIRRLKNSFPGLRQDDLNKASEILTKKSEGLPLYIKEAVKILEKKGFNLELLNELPSGIAKMILSILFEEGERNSSLLFVYFLVANYPRFPRRLLEYIDNFFGIEESLYMDESSDGKLSLHSWYRDILNCLLDMRNPSDILNWLGISEDSSEIVNKLLGFVKKTIEQRNIFNRISNNYERIFADFLKDFLKRNPNNPILNELNKHIEEFFDHPNSIKPLDLSDAILLSSIIGYVDGEIRKNDKNHYGFNILKEKVDYSLIAPSSLDAYNELIGFLANSIAEESSRISEGKIRPFYLFLLLVIMNLFNDKAINTLEKGFLKIGAQGEMNYEEILINSINSSYVIRRYIAALISALKSMGFLTFNYDNPYEMALIYTLELKYEEAIKEYNKAIDLNPNNPDYHKNKGNALCELQRYEEAIEEFNIAIGLNPNNPDYHNNKGNALAVLGRYDEAIKEYDIAIGLNPNNPDYHNNKGNALAVLGRYDEAIKEYDKALAIDPNYTLVLENKKKILEKLKEKRN
jgi:tetratricopeptide (TPR) repeat protein